MNLLSFQLENQEYHPKFGQFRESGECVDLQVADASDPNQPVYICVTAC